MPDQLHPSELNLPKSLEKITAIEQKEKATRHVKTAIQKLADLENQLVKVQAEVRRMDAHRKIILGGACMAVLRDHSTDSEIFKRLLKDKIALKDFAAVSDLLP